MHTITFTEDGEFKLSQRVFHIQQNESTTVQILSNDDSAIITFGTADDEDTFYPYADGVISTDAIIYHGKGVVLWVKVVGIDTNPVVIGYSN